MLDFDPTFKRPSASGLLTTVGQLRYVLACDFGAYEIAQDMTTIYRNAACVESIVDFLPDMAIDQCIKLLTQCAASCTLECLRAEYRPTYFARVAHEGASGFGLAGTPEMALCLAMADSVGYTVLR